VANIMIIDDEQDVRDAIEMTLVAAGHQVRTAANGQAALEACRTEVPNIVLTDLVMPHKHGFEVIAELRRLAPTARIVAISGGGDFGPQAYQPQSVTTNAYLAAAVELGAHAILRKPFNRKELLAVIEQCLASAPRP
jgi:DNA-binding response OmpR family regulator